MNRIVYIFLMAAVSGCAPSMDMQGHDPREYYAQHPMENKVETKYSTYTVRFNRGQNTISYDTLDGLASSWNDISPSATESLQVEMHPAQINNTGRRDAVTRALRRMGYSNRMIMFEPSENIERDEALINIGYASVISPRCPDWRKASNHNYSNTVASNIGCASTTNLGLMVADPRDLVRGAGTAGGDPERNSVVLREYHTNKDYSAQSGSSGGAASSGDGAAGAAQ